jgi:hypothetical protein
VDLQESGHHLSGWMLVWGPLKLVCVGSVCLKAWLKDYESSRWMADCTLHRNGGQLPEVKEHNQSAQESTYMQTTHTKTTVDKSDRAI